MHDTTTRPQTVQLGHVAVITGDLERLRAFYEHTVGLRLAVIDRPDSDRFSRVGVFTADARVALIALEQPDVDLPAPSPVAPVQPIDHFTLFVSTEEDFERVRARLVAAGATDGEVCPIGPTYSVGFHDPDGRLVQLHRMRDDWAPGPEAEVFVDDVRLV